MRIQVVNNNIISPFLSVFDEQMPKFLPLGERSTSLLPFYKLEQTWGLGEQLW